LQFRIQGFDDQKLKDAQATGEALSPQKRTSGTSKHSLLFFYIYGSFLPSWILTRIRIIRIRMQQLKLMRNLADPDPQPKKPKKLSPSFQKYGFGIRNPRSRIRKKPIPYSGVKKKLDPGFATLCCGTGIGSVGTNGITKDEISF
jgi:hypothetical protein